MQINQHLYLLSQLKLHGLNIQSDATHTERGQVPLSDLLSEVLRKPT